MTSLGKDFLNLLYLLFTPENSIKSAGGSITCYLPSTAFTYVAIVFHMLSDSSESNILKSYFSIVTINSHGQSKELNSSFQKGYEVIK